MLCKACGKSNPEDARFCTGCGKPLTQPQRPQSVTQEAPNTEELPRRVRIARPVGENPAQPQSSTARASHMASEGAPRQQEQPIRRQVTVDSDRRSATPDEQPMRRAATPSEQPALRQLGDQPMRRPSSPGEQPVRRQVPVNANGFKRPIPQNTAATPTDRGVAPHQAPRSTAEQSAATPTSGVPRSPRANPELTQEYLAAKRREQAQATNVRQVKMASFQDEEEDDDEEYDDTEPDGRPNWVKIGAISASVVVVVIVAFAFWAFGTGSGQQWRATMGMGTSASAYWQMGDEQLAENRLSAALEAYEKAIRLDSKNFEGAMKLGNTLKIADNLERAEMAFKMAMALQPTSYEPYEALVGLYADDDRSDELLNLLVVAYEKTSNEMFKEKLAQFKPATPSVSLAGGSFMQPIEVAINSTEGLEIRYTIDGTEPKADSNLYTQPLSFSDGEIKLRAVTVRHSVLSQEIVEEYSINIPTASDPVFSSKPGRYPTDNGLNTKAIMMHVPEGATVYYTTDGSTPTLASKLYNEDTGVLLSAGKYTVSAIADIAGQVSDVIKAEYTITGITDEEPLNKNDGFKSFVLRKTTRESVEAKVKFKSIDGIIGDEKSKYTVKYSFGDVDYRVVKGDSIVYGVHIVDGGITGVRGSKVGWKADGVIALFRDEGFGVKNGERVLYTMDNDRYGWVEYDGNYIAEIHYMYLPNDSQLVELIYTVKNGKVTKIDFEIGDME